MVGMLPCANPKKLRDQNLNPQLNTNTRRCPELRSLGRTLKRRRADILAYFTHRHSSNGPTEAINGRLEPLRGIAMGFDNFEHYRQRSLIHSGRIKDILTH